MTDNIGYPALPIDWRTALQPIDSPGAPAAIGPYCQAMRAGDLLFCSGQTPIDPTTNRLIDGTIEEQTERVLLNLSQVLEAAGLSLQQVVRTGVFLRDMGDFEGMNRAYERMFGDHKPARTTVAVRSNPLDARVEIDCVASFI